MSLQDFQFDILAKGRSDIQCEIKEILLIRDLKPYPKRIRKQRKAVSLLTSISHLFLLLFTIFVTLIVLKPLISYLCHI